MQIGAVAIDAATFGQAGGRELIILTLPRLVKPVLIARLGDFLQDEIASSTQIVPSFSVSLLDDFAATHTD